MQEVILPLYISLIRIRNVVLVVYSQGHHIDREHAGSYENNTITEAAVVCRTTQATVPHSPQRRQRRDFLQVFRNEDKLNEVN